ncbi:maker145 [Drosophila busckii]|uniref:Maker145 n=1 Tax=Drosophila busckii TaxID=30019 RepID=A0A0M4EIS4_DROBS|nr:calmodulin [Drosophila busckii]ALC42747.1 maker145 [Drosophila busckii]
MDLTPQQFACFREVFQYLNLDGDDSVSLREFLTVMEGLGLNPFEGDVQSLINEVDLDGNGSIEFNEFVALMINRLTQIYKAEDMIDAFQVFDKSNSGYLDAGELRTVYLALGVKITNAEIDEIISAADFDGDGVIGFDDFIQMMTEHVE